MSKFTSGTLNSLLLCLFPVSITILPILHGVVLFIVVLFSLKLYFHRSYKLYLNDDERGFFIAVFSMIAVAFFVTVIINLEPSGLQEISKFILLLMVIPAYYYFQVSGINYKWFWYGLIAGSVMSAVVGIYEVTFDIYKYGYDGRAKGSTHPIIFGDLALLMGVMSVAGLRWFKAKRNWMIVFPVLALCSGLVASALSSSRGGWVAVPFFAIIFIWASKLYISRIKRLIGVISFALILTVIYLVPETGLQQKIQVTVHNVHDYLGSDVSDFRRNTSIGTRFEMWQASWSIFIDHPIFGVGWGNYQKYAQVLVDNGLRNEVASSHTHPHNQFLSSLVSGGVVALVVTILLFYMPVKIFLNSLKLCDRSLDQQMIALAGLLMVVGFTIFNLSESFLERSRTVTFFVFYLAVCMAGIRDNQKIVS